MNNFFNRVAQLIIGKPSAAGVLPLGVNISTPLRISFNVVKTQLSSQNTAIITINNLSDNTRNAIRSDRKLVGVLKAGYQENGGPQLLFYGDIVNVSHNIQKPEVETTITLMDGYSNIKEKKISVSYRKGTSIQNIISDAINALGLPLNVAFRYTELPANPIDGSLVHAGSAANLLDKICKDNGLLWSVQNGAIKIYKEDSHDNTPPLSSVLIGSPKRLFKNETSVSSNDFSGYEFDALLMPKCEPGNIVTFTSLEVPKPVKLVAMEVKHTGDNFGDSWQTTVKARDL